MKPTIFLLIIIILVISTAFLIFGIAKMPTEFQIAQFNAIQEEILVGVISDTHIPSKADEIPPVIKKIFQNVSLIIHAGDIVSLEVIEELEEIAPVIVVWGNMDPAWVREKLPEALRLKVYNWEIGIVHHPTSYLLFDFFGIFAEGLAKKQKFDILIFGHTHRPFLKDNGILIINPGSPTNPFLAKPSVALLTISKDSFEGKIVYL